MIFQDAELTLAVLTDLFFFFVCFAGSDHWLPVQPSGSRLLPADLGEDRQLLHDWPLRSSRHHLVTCEPGTRSFLFGFVEHLSWRHRSGSRHRGRRRPGFTCELPAGSAAGSSPVLTAANSAADHHGSGVTLRAALRHRRCRPPCHQNGHESSDYPVLVPTFRAAVERREAGEAADESRAAVPLHRLQCCRFYLRLLCACPLLDLKPCLGFLCKLFGHFDGRYHLGTCCSFRQNASCFRSNRSIVKGWNWYLGK